MAAARSALFRMQDSVRPALEKLANRVPVIQGLVTQLLGPSKPSEAPAQESEAPAQGSEARNQGSEARNQGSEEPKTDSSFGRFPPGHFHSPIPSMEEVMRRQDELFSANPPRTLPGIDLNEAGQLALLEEFSRFRAEMPFIEGGRPGMRYVWDNIMYMGTEGALLYYMMRHLRPRRIIEIGSGYSTCFMLDTNELFFGNEVALTCIEPYPQRLQSLLRPEDFSAITLRQQPLESVPLSLFSSLQQNDILFVDSTHVSKIGSDVNYLLFDVLPSLAPGVFIHIHDIFYPFEYRKHWLVEGFYWNEAYTLRAFLQFNSQFRIAFFHDFMLHFHREQLVRDFPHLWWGQNIWLERRA